MCFKGYRPTIFSIRTKLEEGLFKYTTSCEPHFFYCSGQGGPMVVGGKGLARRGVNSLMLEVLGRLKTQISETGVLYLRHMVIS